MQVNPLLRKCLAVGIILFFIGTGSAPSIPANISHKTTIIDPIQLIINNDGSGNPTDKKVDVPGYTPDSGITPTLTINFTILGTNSSESTAFYGDDPWEDWKNITVFGDILYPVNRTTLFHVGTQGDWDCCVTPTEPYGIIALKIDWPGNGSAEEYIEIENGTFVTPMVDSFPWGQDCNLTFFIQDIDETPVKIAKVYLIWEEDDYEFNHTIGNNKPGNGLNGEYTFWITRADQGEVAPKNITIAAQWIAGYWGYAKVTMERPSRPPLVYVDDDFTNSTPGWGYNHFNKIQDGVNAVATNGTVFVYNGTYPENVVVNNSLTLLGENKNTTLIGGAMNGSGVNITADNVTVSGFTIQNYTQGYGIVLSSNNNRITKTIIADNGFGIGTNYVIQFYPPSLPSGFNTITDNLIIRNTGGGLGLTGQNNTVVGNSISRTQYGIMVGAGEYNNISKNTIMDNENGIFIVISYNTMIYRNNISQNEKLGISDYCTSSTMVLQNNFIRNGQSAYFNQPLLMRRQIFKTFFHAPIKHGIWAENYWDRPRMMPYLIPGLVSLIHGPIVDAPYHANFFQVDRRPAKNPYDLP